MASKVLPLGVTVSRSRDHTSQTRVSAKHTEFIGSKAFVRRITSNRTRFLVSKSRFEVRASEEAGTSATENVLDCVVVGGGLSGLCIGQVLNKKKIAKSFLVTESRERVGGNITTVSNDDYLWEEGPNSFQPSDAMLRMTTDVGLVDELALGDSKAPRFVWWEGRLRPTPDGLASLPTFDLLSIWGKIRAGLGAVGIKAGMPETEESVEQFIRRNLGEEVFMRLIEPFCSGVYAGDPSKLGMKAAFGKIHILEETGGSLVGGAIKLFQNKKNDPPRDADLPPKPPGATVASYKKGLKQLPEAIVAQIPDNIRVNWTLKEIAIQEPGLYSLTYQTPQGTEKVLTRCVVMTAPSYVVSSLVSSIAPGAATALEKIVYPPVAAVTIAYPLSSVKDDAPPLRSGTMEGFGQLHPRSQGITTLGTIYSSVLFPGRAPEPMLMLLNYIGGRKNQGIKEQTKEELVAQVDKDVRTMLIKADAPPPEVMGVRVWERAIPQFDVGHLDILDAARKSLDASGLDKVVLAGNYVAGVAIGKCVEGAYAKCDEIEKLLK
eukprot:CAMPEP_0196594364 /NCGR_PEP_ID=MMETSP1081-20130531/78159_1 /TAXON_ID=36882 /ORGANISM="Pyramimonas amylifera, Strain CCMP720" /LENGTH=546 /DNA_ID=CAMNT_0041918615 /DNA_START=135 /DNA_END=1775 /DNA_ORIENTATION=-